MRARGGSATGALDAARPWMDPFVKVDTSRRRFQGMIGRESGTPFRSTFTRIPRLLSRRYFVLYGISSS